MQCEALYIYVKLPKDRDYTLNHIVILNSYFLIPMDINIDGDTHISWYPCTILM